MTPDCSLKSIDGNEILDGPEYWPSIREEFGLGTRTARSKLAFNPLGQQVEACARPVPAGVK